MRINNIFFVYIYIYIIIIIKELMGKNFVRILFEAFIVGILLIIIYNFIKYILINYNYNIILLISGALFHIICEYIGLNIWYVNDYNKILNK
jgi:hypothetical protein